MTAYDFFKTIDHQGERDSLEQARIEHLASQIRSDMKPSDFINEIECDASFDTDCIKAIQMLFIGADQAMKLAQEYRK